MCASIHSPVALAKIITKTKKSLPFFETPSEHLSNHLMEIKHRLTPNNLHKVTDLINNKTRKIKLMNQNS